MQNSTQAANAWRILFLLFLANLFNFFDRTIPAIIIEPIRMEWHLSDFQLGIIGTAFTIVYAIAGLPLGRLADTGSRSKLMGWGLASWSALTAVNGMVGSFWTFLLVRMGIGIGEASYAPAANSLIGDLFPAHRRARSPPRPRRRCRLRRRNPPCRFLRNPRATSAPRSAPVTRWWSPEAPCSRCCWPPSFSAVGRCGWARSATTRPARCRRTWQ